MPASSLPRRPLSHWLPRFWPSVPAFWRTTPPAATLLDGRRVLAVALVAVFIGLTWVRAESLAVMMPGAVNLGLGVCTGLLGNSLGHWVGALGLGTTRACVVTQALKLAQIVGVPAGYLLLGGHMLALPLLGAGLALAGVVWAYRRGQPCTVPATTQQ